MVVRLAPRALIEHRQENYPPERYRQPRPVFWHDATPEVMARCPLCQQDAPLDA